MKCTKTLDNGNQCQAHPVRGKKYCFRHEPSMTTKAQQASINGGTRRKVLHQRYGDAIEIQTPDDIKRLLADTINSVWQGDCPSNSPANTIGFLARCWLDAHDKTTLEERLEALEKKVEAL